MMMVRVRWFLTAALLTSLATGCSQTESASSTSSGKFRLRAEPKGAISVSQLRQTAGDQQTVTVVGQIGGESNPWVDGMAAFMLADEGTLERCKAECADKNCNCQSKELSEASVLVKFVDKNGEPLQVDSRELLAVGEHDKVVVQGKAERDPDGNVVVVAGGIFVRR